MTGESAVVIINVGEGHDICAKINPGVEAIWRGDDITKIRVDIVGLTDDMELLIKKLRGE